MKFHNLKIGNQLNAGFGVILILILFLSIVAWQMNNMLAKQTTDLYNHPHTVRKAVLTLRSDVLLIQRGMKDLALVDNEEDRSKIMQEIKVYEDDINKQFPILYDRYLGPKSDIDSASANFIKWNSVREKTISLLHEGKMDEVISRTRLGGAGSMQAERMLDAVKRIDIFSSNKSTEFFQRAIMLNQNLKYQLVIAVTAVMLLTIFIVNYLSRNIRNPLSLLTAATNDFRAGKRSSRSSYSYRNEFGALSSAFNEMADTIETELSLNEKSADITSVMLSESDAHHFSKTLLSTLLEHTGGQMGAIFLLNEEKTEFELFESIGIESGSKNSFSASEHEGELGLAAATKKIQHISGISGDSLFTFNAVSGKYKPSEIVSIPLIANNTAIAVISLATVHRFYKNSFRLLETIFTTLSARMDAILSYRKIVDFSQKLEHQNRELEAQKNELSVQANELGQQNIELGMQKRQVDESNRLKTAFLSNMSHELRTPLNSVIALSGVLNRRLKDKIPEEEYSYLEVIGRNGKQLLELINDILDLSRIESGREEVIISSFRVNQLITEVLEVIEPTARQKNITLKVKGNDQAEMKSDFEKCRHILQNIIANAVKFTEKGGVEVEAQASNTSVRIFVRDSGIGIEKEFLTHIFEEFRQVESSTSRKYGGTGLGLAIAKKYATLLGGSIEVESTPGKGSTFTINLPLVVSSENQEEIRDEIFFPETKSEVSAETGKTILLVEDMEPVIIQLKDFLEARDYSIEVARNGTEALEIIENKIPDAMILDLMMPGIDGFEVLRRIRSMDKTSKIPVIVLTAKYITKEEYVFLKQDNVFQLIQKGNINKEQLLNAVSRMMNQSNGENKKSQNEKVRQNINASQKDALVLVIEDNPDNLTTIKALLSGKCRIIEGEDGQSGISLAEKHKPDLILLDIALPGMNGVEVLQKLKNHNELKSTPVVAVTASAMKGEREELLDKGFDNYISKPIDYDIFHKIINEFI